MEKYPKATWLALPLGLELTRNVMLFPVGFGVLFRPRNVKYLVGSRGKVLQYFLPGTAKTDDQLSLDLVQTEIAPGRFRDFGGLIRRRRHVAESPHLAFLPLTSADLADEKHYPFCGREPR